MSQTMVGLESKELTYVNNMISEGEYDKALKIIESLESKGGLTPTDKVIYTLL